MALVQNTAPSSEPIELEAAKDHLRVDVPDDDALIAAYLSAARGAAEDFSGLQFITATYTLYLDYFPVWTFRLPKPPLQAVNSLKYLDVNGDEQTLVEGTDYVVDTKSWPGRITPAYGKVWPVTRDIINAVYVEFDAGFGDTGTDVDEPILQAVKLILGDLYANRENLDRSPKVPRPAELLMWPYRRWGLQA